MAFVLKQIYSHTNHFIYGDNFRDTIPAVTVVFCFPSIGGDNDCFFSQSVHLLFAVLLFRFLF